MLPQTLLLLNLSYRNYVKKTIDVDSPSFIIKAHELMYEYDLHADS